MMSESANTEATYTLFFLSNCNKKHMKLVKQVIRLIFRYKNAENVKH